MNFEQNHASQVNLSLFQNIPEHFNESREDLLSTDEKMYYSNTHLALPHNSNTNLTISTNNMYVPSTESLHNSNQIMESRTSLQTSSILDINHPMNSAVMGSSQWNHAGSNTSLVNRTQSSSCIDLTNNNNVIKERFLPKYRPAPAYEIAIQQKFKGGGGGQQQQHDDVSIPKPQLMYENFHHHHQHQQNQQPAKNMHYPDVTHITHHASNNMINPSYVDASDYLSQRLNLFNPPTQYPANRLSSTSTPDLALASHRGIFGYRHTGSSPDLLSRTLLHQQHGFIPSNPHSILYPYTSVATSVGGGGGLKQRLRHSHSFLPHATYENLNFIEATTNNNPQSFFPSSKHIPNNMIYRTASSAQQLADMEYYLHKQHRNHSLNALNLSNSHISEPIYENVPLPMNNASTTTPINVERKISSNENRPVRPRPRLVHTEPSIDVVSSSVNASNNFNMVNANAFSSNNNNGSTKNINDPLNGNEIAANNNNNNNNKKHFILTTNNDNNGNKISGSSISITNISASNERDYSTSAILPASSSSSSPFHIENMQINRQRQAISSNPTALMNTSGTSSNYTINTTTTADTTDSGISTEMGIKKESKRNKFWAILGKNKSSSKQKSATLGREKEKNKKDKGREMSKEMHDNTNHRWSTGLHGRQPLPISTISKEKLCQLLDAKLNDAQLFLEFERIPKRKDNAQYSCALMEENRNKNSDNTCLPMDENRVRLTTTRDNRMGYVNASHISSTVGQKQRFYIAAQSASNTFTANIFWQGVWEADVYLLIQLTDEFVYVPPNSERCSEYGQVREQSSSFSLILYGLDSIPSLCDFFSIKFGENFLKRRAELQLVS